MNSIDLTNYSPEQILIGVLITAVYFLLLPSILSLTLMRKKPIKHSSIRYIAIAATGSLWLFASAMSYSQTGRIESIIPALLWGGIGHSMMLKTARKHGNLIDDDQSRSKNQKENKKDSQVPSPEPFTEDKQTAEVPVTSGAIIKEPAGSIPTVSNPIDDIPFKELHILKDLHDMGLLSDQEYADKKKVLLKL